MSATMTVTMAQPAALQMSTSSSPCCPQCGFMLHFPPPMSDAQSALLEAQKQVEGLEAQIRLLDQKAAAAIDRWADYEDELSRLRRQMQQQQQQSPPPQQLSPRAVASPMRTSFLSSTAATRISALLSPRSAKSTPNLKMATPPPPPPPPIPGSSTSSFGLSSPRTPFTPLTSPGSPDPRSADDLLEALSREQNLRLVAEGKLNDTSREVEELSTQLFEQANEMVASERRARARLEERVEVLERRDVEKRQRFERLEHAMARIERVRALLEQPAEAAAKTDAKGG